MLALWVYLSGMTANPHPLLVLFGLRACYSHTLGRRERREHEHESSRGEAHESTNDTTMVRFYHHHQLSSLSCTVQGNSTTQQHARQGAAALAIATRGFFSLPLPPRLSSGACVFCVSVFVRVCVCVCDCVPPTPPPLEWLAPTLPCTPTTAAQQPSLRRDPIWAVLSWYFESTCPPSGPLGGRVHKRMGNRRNPKSKPHSRTWIRVPYAYICLRGPHIPALHPRQ